MALAGGGTVTTSNFNNFLETRWAPRLFLDATEEMTIGRRFLQNSDLQIDKMNNQLYIRRIAPKTTNKPAGTSALDITLISVEADTETGTSVSPQFYYCAVAVTQQVQTRMMAYPAYEKAIREQFMRSMSEQIDADCGALAASFTNTVSDANISAALIRSALATLRQNAKREAKIGEAAITLRIHPAQAANLYGIPEAANADIRSDDGANVSGVIVKLWGADVDVTGSVYTSAGSRYNMAFVKNGNALPFNQEPTLAPPQPTGLATLLAGFAEAGAATLYQDYNVALITS